MLDDLPVAAALRDRIDAWQSVYDEHDDMDEDAPVLDVARFAAEGLAIARSLKAALPDWTVIYHDEAKSKRGLPGAACEFEITTQPG